MRIFGVAQPGYVAVRDDLDQVRRPMLVAHNHNLIVARYISRPRAVQPVQPFQLPGGKGRFVQRPEQACLHVQPQPVILRSGLREKIHRYVRMRLLQPVPAFAKGSQMRVSNQQNPGHLENASNSASSHTTSSAASSAARSAPCSDAG